jgi:hypothetical protein
MTKKLTLVSTLAAALFALIPSAHATSETGTYAYFVHYNFSEVAFGKRVASVVVHTAVLRGPDECRGAFETYWENIQDVQMTTSNGNFTATAKVQSSVGECQPSQLGPIVQYWVNFKDGTQLITTSALVPVLTQLYGGQNPAPAEAQAKQIIDNMDASAPTIAVFVNESYAD